MVDIFSFHFFEKGAFLHDCESMEIGNIEGMIALILEHYIAHFDLQQKIDHLFFHEICTVWRVYALVHSVKVFKSGSSQVF